MMTFKELKKLVKLPLYKEQRVPTVKALEESGVSVVAEKILENHGSISVYQNGYVIYRAHRTGIVRRKAGDIPANGQPVHHGRYAADHDRFAQPL